MKRFSIFFLTIVFVLSFFACQQKTMEIEKLVQEVEKINETIPNNIFLYLYRDGTTYYFYSLDEKNKSGVFDYRLEDPLQLLEEIRQGMTLENANQNEIIDVQVLIYNTLKEFLDQATNGSKPFRVKPFSFENPLPRYTHDVNKCQMINLKRNDAGFPAEKESIAYFTIDDGSCEFIYYGENDETVIELYFYTEDQGT